MSNKAEIVTLLSVIRDYTENNERLHRAKALKWTSDQIAVSKTSLNQKEKDSIWEQVIKNNYALLDERGNILSLSDIGLNYFKDNR